MKMKPIVLFRFILILTSCHSFNDSDKKGSESNATNYFFDFDQLDHYKIDIDENDLLQKENDKFISSDEQLQLDLIILDKPNSVNDTLFIKQLENIGFLKTKISKNKFKNISGIFKEKEVDESIAYSCVAVYRDILIFKKENRIIGMAKICFSCDQNRIYGTKANTINFGQGGDYSKLSNILNH